MASIRKWYEMGRGYLNLGSLRNQLILLVAMVSAPSVLLTLYTGWKMRQHAVMSADENLRQLVRLAASNEEKSLETAKQILRELSTTPGLMDSFDVCHTRTATSLSTNKGYLNFVVARVNGDIVCSTDKSGRKVASRDLNFQRAIVGKRFVAGSYQVAKLGKKHLLSLKYPILTSKDEVIGVVFAEVDLMNLDSALNEIQLPSNSVLLTFDSQGVIYSHRPEPEQWFGRIVPGDVMDAMTHGQDQTHLVVDHDGIERLYAFSRVGGSDHSDFVMAIGIPSEQIVGAARRDQLVALTLLGASTLLAFFAAWFVGDIAIARRVRALVDVAEHIAEGRFGARAGRLNASEELEDLAGVLDRMAASLQQKADTAFQVTNALRESNRTKEAYLSVIAHEFQSRLRNLHNNFRLLIDGAVGSALLRESVGKVSNKLQGLADLANDLVDVSHATMGLMSIQKRSVDIKSIIVDAIDSRKNDISSRGHHLDLQLPAESALVMADRNRLIQALSKLLDNAVQRTPDGGHIVVRLERVDDEVVVAIVDNGIGLAPDEADAIFDRFSLANSHLSGDDVAICVSLTLVKLIVELHDGSVAAFSKGLGSGSTFSVRLPKIANVPITVEQVS